MSCRLTIALRCSDPAYLSQGLDRDSSDHLRYSFDLPSEDQLKAYLYQQELLQELASNGTSDEEDGSDEEDMSSASASSSISPVLPTGLLPAPTDKLDPPKIEYPPLPFLDDLEDDGVHPFGKHMAHLPALPSIDPSSSTPAPSFALAVIVPETPLDRAATPVVDEIDSLLPDFLRPIPFASSSLASAGPVVFPTPDDLSKQHHSAPTMAHSATLPALIGAYSALQTAIRADPSSLLATGGYGSTSKNVKRLRAAYHLSFHSAPPETYTPSPSLFGSLPVPSPRTTAIVPQIPPSTSGVTLPPEVARVRSRQVLAGLPTSALTPGGAHRHPNMLGNVLHYIAPPALLGRTSRMTEPKPLVDKGAELYYGPVYESKGVVVTTTGGGVRRVKISKPASTYNKGKGKKKKKGNESDEDFEALLDDEASDDGDFGRKGSVGGLGGGAVAGEEWAEEEIELKVEVNEVPVELRATVSYFSSLFPSSLPFFRCFSRELILTPSLGWPFSAPHSGTRRCAISRATSCRSSG